MLGRALCEGLFADVVAACDPAVRVRAALEREPIDVAGDTFGIAIGKAALAMARGAGPVTRGVCVTNADDDRELPAGWTVMVSAHPEPDERSLAAGDAVVDLVASAGKRDAILALVSGGASSLVERPLSGITLAQLRTDIGELMASGASIHELNRARIARSALKGGKLARLAEAPIRTLVVSDVFDDDLATIGSGPTFPPREHDRIQLVAKMSSAVEELYASLAHRERIMISAPLVGLVDDVAKQIAGWLHWRQDHGIFVAWGEATVHIPADHGVGGRAQQLALILARMLAGSADSAFVIGTDGVDGAPPRDRPMPAGAYVDGTTWAALAAAGIDGDAALARCDAGTALAAVGALVITGPTGINHGDLILLG